MTEGTKKVLKIGGIILLIGAAIFVIYYLLKGSSGTVNGKKGDSPYVGSISASAYSAFWDALVHNICPNPEQYYGRTYTCEELARGYLKKNNLAMTPANVSMFSSEIKAYVEAPGSLPHWKL